MMVQKGSEVLDINSPAESMKYLRMQVPEKKKKKKKISNLDDFM